MNGYGIYKLANGDVYYGEWSWDTKDGNGYYKWANGNEYWGIWSRDMQQGKGVSQEGGVFYRDYYQYGKLFTRSKIQ